MDKNIFRYGSHLPVQRAIMSTLPVTGVMEIGTGKASTKFFHDCDIETVSIEEDLFWLDKMKNELPKSEKHKFIHHKISDKNIHTKTSWNNMPEAVIAESVKFYRDQMKDVYNYLFVDQFTGLRIYSLLNLYYNFDFIVFHDVEFFEGYGYHLFKPNLEMYLLGFHVLKSSAPIPSTGILFKKKYRGLIDAFEAELMREQSEYFKNSTAKIEGTFKRKFK